MEHCQRLNFGGKPRRIAPKVTPAPIIETVAPVAPPMPAPDIQPEPVTVAAVPKPPRSFKRKVNFKTKLERLQSNG